VLAGEVRPDKAGARLYPERRSCGGIKLTHAPLD